MGDFKDLFAYQKGYIVAMKIFRLSQNFPREERYSLTDQIRRSSRSVCANLAEAYKRRMYKDYYTSKLNDAESENAETQVWLDFAKDCQYLAINDYEDLVQSNTEVGKLLGYMIKNFEKFKKL